ncbi:MAG: ferredoxin family protein [Chloroflexi bacterium]|nr:ferredoxin family protein [Chloroflexota bacterium]
MTIKNIDANACLCCGICWTICPNDVLRPGEDDIPFIAYVEDCTACKLCEDRCAVNAIQVQPGAAAKANEAFAMRQYLIGLGINPESTGLGDDAL